MNKEPTRVDYLSLSFLTSWLIALNTIRNLGDDAFKGDGITVKVDCGDADTARQVHEELVRSSPPFPKVGLVYRIAVVGTEVVGNVRETT